MENNFKRALPCDAVIGYEKALAKLDKMKDQTSRRRACLCQASKQAEEMYEKNSEVWKRQADFVKAAIALPLDGSVLHDDDLARARVLMDELKYSRDTQDIGMSGKHRPRDSLPLWCAMVTKTLHPADPLIRCAEALKALDAELTRLRNISTWCEEKPLELSDAKLKFPNAHFAHIFAIYGIKNSEFDVSMHKWKARVVFGGDKIKDASDEYAIFADVGSTPSNMVSA